MTTVDAQRSPLALLLADPQTISPALFFRVPTGAVFVFRFFEPFGFLGKGGAYGCRAAMGVVEILAI